MDKVWLLTLSWCRGEHFIFGAYPTKEAAEDQIGAATAQALGHSGWEIKPVPYIRIAPKRLENQND